MGKNNINDMITRLTSIRNKVTNDTTAEEFQIILKEFNIALIEAVMGGETKIDKKGRTIISLKPFKQPDNNGLSALIAENDAFVKKCERFTIITVSDDIPEAVPGEVVTNTPVTGKVNMKAFKELLTSQALFVEHLDGPVITKLSAIASTLRKHRIIMISVIATGVTLVAAGGVAFAVAKKRAKADGIDELGNITMIGSDIGDGIAQERGEYESVDTSKL